MLRVDSLPVATEQLSLSSKLDNISRHLYKLYPPELQWKRDHGQDVAVIVSKLINAEMNNSSTSEEIKKKWVKLMPRVLFAVAHHDIGKLFLEKDVDDKPITMDRRIAIINKDGPLDVEEEKVLQTHPLIGAQFLESLLKRVGTDDPFIVAIVASHHRRQGDYPRKNDPDFQRILARLTPEEAIFAELAGYFLELGDSVHAIMGPRVYDPKRDSNDAFGKLHASKIWEGDLISLAIAKCEEVLSPGQRFGR